MAVVLCSLLLHSRILSNFIAHKFTLMQQYEHIDNSGVMLLPTHPKGPGGKPLVPRLNFGPDPSMRQSGQALGTS